MNLRPTLWKRLLGKTVLHNLRTGELHSSPCGRCCNHALKKNFEWITRARAARLLLTGKARACCVCFDRSLLIDYGFSYE